MGPLGASIVDAVELTSTENAHPQGSIRLNNARRPREGAERKFRPSSNLFAECGGREQSRLTFRREAITSVSTLNREVPL
jgi:hypothetical protein